MKTLRIGNRTIGGDAPCFIIAEGGINHNGDIRLALRLMDEAKKAGADAIKFQKRTVGDILTRQAFDAPYVGPNSYGRTYGEHRLKLELSATEWKRLIEHGRRIGILCFASAWDERSVDFLEKLGVPAYKVASADITNTPLLRYIAARQKPVFLSTGMSTMKEIDAAVKTVLRINPRLVLMHAVSAYPLDPPLANLRMIVTLRKRYPGVLIGYSGHEKSGLVISLGACLLGARVIERHFTLDRTMRGSDHTASLEPGGLSQLVEDIRKLEEAAGDGRKRIIAEERPIRAKLAKSITAAKPIRKGDVLRRSMLCMKSPGTGLPGSCMERLIGRVAKRDVPDDGQLPRESLKWPKRGSRK